MTTSEYSSSSSSSSETDVDKAHEYYEEVDNHTLNFQKQKAPKSTSVPTKSVVKEPAPLPPPPPVIDPIQKLNEQLNRKFRPDLVLPSPSPPPISPEPVIKRTPTPDPIIFDARTKPIKAPKKKNEPLFNLKQKLFNRNHQFAESTATSTPSNLVMTQQSTNMDNFQVPPGMMLVPAPQQQIQPTVSQYKPPTLNYSTSVKTNKVAPPPSTYNNHTVNHGVPINSFQSPSSLVSTNHLIQSSYALKQQQQQQQQQQENLFKHIDQSKSTKKNKKKKTDDNITNTQNGNRAFALYNQKNGRIEGVVKNRLNVATDDVEESRILDDETEPKGKWALWLSQPLCLGLTRLSGGVLFGSMILLGCASVAGLIASIVLYSQDSVTDAQWKILGMVVCAIMLITIIITLLIFVCCYKHGYMFDKDDDIDAADPSTTQDAEGNERQKAVLRKIYKFNRPNDTSSIPSNIPHNVSTSPPPISQPTIFVTDKQTNTEATIAVVRPKDLNRGVWASANAYGGISYRPLIPPQMVSRFIQVLPHEIEQTMQPQQVIYQVVAPAAAIPPPQIQSRIIQIPAEQSSSNIIEYIETTQQQQQQPQIVEYVQTTQRQQPRTIQIPVQQPQTIEYVETTQRQQPRTIQIPVQQPQTIEYIETTQKQQPRTIQIPAPQSPLVEYIETTQKQPRTTIIRQPQTQQIVVQPSTRIEYVDSDDQQTHRVVQQPTTRIEYVNAKDQRTHHRNVQQPQYEIVEEVVDRSSASPMEEYVEVIDAPKHGRHREKKKDKKRGFGKIIVKHIRSDND